MVGELFSLGKSWELRIEGLMLPPTLNLLNQARLDANHSGSRAPLTIYCWNFWLYDIEFSQPSKAQKSI